KPCAIDGRARGRLGTAQNRPAQAQEMPAPYAHAGFHIGLGRACHPQQGLAWGAHELPLARRGKTTAR
ncbi:MAG: hypothetical protein ACKO51_03130, partial [Alphaproteobacteria bacterium]